MVAISAGCSPYRAARYVGSEQGGGHLVGFGRCFILFRGEQQRHVDRDPGIHAFLNGGQALGGSRDLDEQVAPGALAAQGRGLLDGALRVVGQQRGYLQRHPAVHTVGAGIDGGELICSPAQVGQGKLEGHLLVGGAGGLAGGDIGVVVRALLDRIVKDGRVGSEPGHRVPGDVAIQDASIEQGSGDVVQPDALARVVQRLGPLHGILPSFWCLADNAGTWLIPGASGPAGPWPPRSHGRARSRMPPAVGHRGQGHQRAGDGRSSRPARRPWTACGSCRCRAGPGPR